MNTDCIKRCIVKTPAIYFRRREEEKVTPMQAENDEEKRKVLLKVKETFISFRKSHLFMKQARQGSASPPPSQKLDGKSMNWSSPSSKWLQGSPLNTILKDWTLHKASQRLIRCSILAICHLWLLAPQNRLRRHGLIFPSGLRGPLPKHGMPCSANCQTFLRGETIS